MNAAFLNHVAKWFRLPPLMLNGPTSFSSHIPEVTKMACSESFDVTYTVTFEPLCSDDYPCLNGRCCVPKDALDNLRAAKANYDSLERSLPSDDCPLMGARCVVPKSTLDALKSDCDDYRKQRDSAADELKRTLNRLTEIESSRDYHRDMDAIHRCDKIDLAQERDAAQKLADSRLDTLRKFQNDLHERDKELIELRAKLEAEEVAAIKLAADELVAERWQATEIERLKSLNARLETEAADARAKYKELETASDPQFNIEWFNRFNRVLDQRDQAFLDSTKLRDRLTAAEAKIKQLESDAIAPLSRRPWLELYNEERIRANALQVKVNELESNADARTEESCRNYLRRNMSLIEETATLRGKLERCSRAFKGFAECARGIKPAALAQLGMTATRLEWLAESLDCAANAV